MALNCQQAFKISACRYPHTLDGYVVLTLSETYSRNFNKYFRRRNYVKSNQYHTFRPFISGRTTNSTCGCHRVKYGYLESFEESKMSTVVR
eukprot:1348287-Amorphochlora_amoeboformis.AAC.1